MVFRFVRLCIVVALSALITWTYITRQLQTEYRRAGQRHAPHLEEPGKKALPLLHTGNHKQNGQIASVDTEKAGSVAQASVGAESAPSATTNDVLNESKFSYIFYATDNIYACSALVNIRRLRSFRTPHRIHLLATEKVSQRYIKAFDALKVTVVPFEPPQLPTGSAGYYDGCLLKLMAFRMQMIDPSIERVIVLDSDQLILQSLDSLFKLPSVDLAAPRAYWIGKDAFASTLMVIEPSERSWQRVRHGMLNLKAGEYDMDLVNQLFGGTVLMLPGSYVTLNSHWEDWNLPDWFRPDSPTTVKMADTSKKEKEMQALREALNKMSGREDGDQSLVPGHQRRDLNEQELSQTSDEAVIEEMPIPERSSLNTTANNKIEAEKTEVLTNDDPSDDWLAYSANGAPEHEPPSSSNDISRAYGENAELPKPKSAHDVDKSSVNWPLQQLYGSAHVLHFTAAGKPWRKKPGIAGTENTEAHSLLFEQFRTWRQEAAKVCPFAKDGEDDPNSD